MPFELSENQVGRRTRDQMTRAKHQHKWTFKARFRSSAYGWKASRLACQRLKEAVTEIKKVARRDPIHAAEGAVALMGRIWPAFQGIDTSSGALGSAVNWTLEELIPLVASAPASREVRDRWLDRLWQAIQDDGVSYLWPVEDHWGELCAAPSVASRWADEILPLLRHTWSDPRAEGFLSGTGLCLSSLLAAGRRQEILDVLELKRHTIWPYQCFGVRALFADGRTDDALAYAEASRGLTNPNCEIDAECERMLLAVDRREEAYRRYAMTANQASTGLATFRRIAKKYPEQEARQILLDLAEFSGDPGRWFAAAKNAGHLDLAITFAVRGQTDPRTLVRGARDFVDTDTTFALRVGRVAIERMLEGHGYELTTGDIVDAYQHFAAAAEKLGFLEDAKQDLASILSGTTSRDPVLAAALHRCL